MKWVMIIPGDRGRVENDSLGRRRGIHSIDVKSWHDICRGAACWSIDGPRS